MEVILFPGFISSMFSESIVSIKLFWEDEGIIRDVARLEVGDLDGGGEDENLDTKAFWVACHFIDIASTFLDAFHSFPGFQGNDNMLFILCSRISIVVGFEGELGGVFVALIIIHAKDIYPAFVALHSGIGSAVVPDDVFLVDKLALALLIPDGALGFINADNIDGIMQRTAFVAKHHLVLLHEKLASLLCRISLLPESGKHSP